MITYKQLVKGSGKTRKNLWYIKGENAALVADALDIAKEHVYSGVSSVCLGVFFGGEQAEELDDFVNRPYFEERKLAIIYDTTNFKDVANHIDLSDKSTFFVIVNYGDVDAPGTLHDLLTNNAKARSVNCALKSEEDLKELVQSRLDISDTALNQLIGKANGDAEWLLNKVSIFERLDVPEVTHKMVGLICTDEGTPQFEDSLVQFDKHGCFMYIRGMGTENIGVRRIIRDVHNLALLNTVSAEHGKQIRPISDRTGLTKQQIDKYIKYVSYYDATSVRRGLTLMTKHFDKLVRGDRLAYIALVSGW